MKTTQKESEPDMSEAIVTARPAAASATATNEQLSALTRLSKDLRRASKTMSPREARYLTDLYYQMQENRIRAEGQIRSIYKSDQPEPHETLAWFGGQAGLLEEELKKALGTFAESKVTGKWSQSILGIGPVISAGLIANIGTTVWKCMGAPDMQTLIPDAKEGGEELPYDDERLGPEDEEFEVARPRREKKPKKPKKWEACKWGKPCTAACGEQRINTASAVWRYAGLDPTVKWEKGKKRPWNASLKRLAWLIGQSFVKVSSRPNDFYGKFYVERKRLEIARNDEGKFADQASYILQTKNIGKETDAWGWYAGCYPAGTTAEMAKYGTLAERQKYLDSVWRGPMKGVRMLPPAQIQQRSERYAAKLFFSHWHQVSYYEAFGERAPAPFAIAILGHSGLIEVPNWPWNEQSEPK